MKDTQKSPIISTDLRQIAEQAKQEPAMVFTSLAHRMDIDFLTEAYHRVRKDGAAGLSGVTAKDYQRNLTDNLTDLHQRLKNQKYVAPKIKRVWIDKDGGKKRPICQSASKTFHVTASNSFHMECRVNPSLSPFSGA